MLGAIDCWGVLDMLVLFEAFLVMHATLKRFGHDCRVSDNRLLFSQARGLLIVMLSDQSNIQTLRSDWKHLA